MPSRRVPALYIADGHHRAASAARARARAARGPGDGRREADTSSPWRFPTSRCRSSLQPDGQGSGGADASEFLAALRQQVPVTDGSPTPARKGEVRCISTAAGIRSTWPAAPGGRLARGRSRRRAAAERGDGAASADRRRPDRQAHRLRRRRPRHGALEQAVDSGKAAVAFSMFPVTVDDLMRDLRRGGIMPPKSTWFEPKLSDGLLIHDICSCPGSSWNR